MCLEEDIWDVNWWKKVENRGGVSKNLLLRGECNETARCTRFVFLDGRSIGTRPNVFPLPRNFTRRYTLFQKYQLQLLYSLSWRVSTNSSKSLASLKPILVVFDEISSIISLSIFEKEWSSGSERFFFSL